MASAVRCPKSASKIAASASRSPVRRPRCLSASDAIDDDGDRPEIEPEQSFDRRGHRRPYLCGERTECLTRARDDTQTHEAAGVDHADAKAGAGEPGTPARSAVADADDARDLESGGLDKFLDDTLADGQDGSTPEATSSYVGVSVLV